MVCNWFFVCFKYLWKFYFENWDVVQERKCLCSVSAGTCLLMGIIFKWGWGKTISICVVMEGHRELSYMSS